MSSPPRDPQEYLGSLDALERTRALLADAERPLVLVGGAPWSAQASTALTAGALSMLVFQLFENIGMTTGIMPITGIPLPLLSYGGSSTMAFLVLIGLVQSVHMHRFV